MPIDRRTLLSRGLVIGGTVVAVGPTGLLGAGRAHAKPAPGSTGGYGPLVDLGDMRLPSGFRFVRFGEAGSMLGDGRPVPSAHDGMGVFARPDGTLAIVRNHELEDPATAFAEPAYDPSGPGGCTTTIWDPSTETVVTSFVSLAGTASNCAGGPTPWGTWLSCEETTAGAGAGFTQPHGYVFEVPATAAGPVAPMPLRAMGRFVHEAAVVDPASGYVYLTEDEGPGDGFYRFRPDVAGDLRSGVLEMAAISGSPGYDTRTGQTLGEPLPVSWVAIADPDPANAEENASVVFEQGLAAGGAVFVALEGCSYHAGSIYLSSSDGGDRGLGQLWRYDVAAASLVLVYESADRAALDGPDNNAASPRGGLAVCEDGDAKSNFVRVLSSDGQLFDFAENTLPYAEAPGAKTRRAQRSEFAGVRYSPDGTWMFVNIQYPGATYAITGPWGTGLL